MPSNRSATNQAVSEERLHKTLNNWVFPIIILGLMWVVVAADVWFCINWLIAPTLQIPTVNAKGALSLAIAVIMFRMDLIRGPSWFNNTEDLHKAWATLLVLSLYFFIVAAVLHLIIK